MKIAMIMVIGLCMADALILYCCLRIGARADRMDEEEMAHRLEKEDGGNG